jgi:hypothetical protein
MTETLTAEDTMMDEQDPQSPCPHGTSIILSLLETICSTGLRSIVHVYESTLKGVEPYSKSIFYQSLVLCGYSQFQSNKT